MSSAPQAAPLGSEGSHSTSSEPKQSPSDQYFSAIASSVDRASILDRRDDSPLFGPDSIRGESAPGARRVPRGAVIPRTLDPVKRAGGSGAQASKVEANNSRSGGAPSSPTAKSTGTQPAWRAKQSGSTPKKGGDSDGDSDLLFGGMTKEVADPKSAPTSPEAAASVRNAIERINSVTERPISPNRGQVDRQRHRQSLIFRSRGSFSSNDGGGHPQNASASASIPTSPEDSHLDSSTLTPASYSPLWRLSKGPVRHRASDAPPNANSSSSSYTSPNSASYAGSRDTGRAHSKSGGQSGFMADVDTPPASRENARGENMRKPVGMPDIVPPVTKGMRVKVTPRYRTSPRSIDTAGSEEDDDLNEVPLSPSSTGQDEVDIAEVLPDYRPPIISTSNSTLNIRRGDSGNLELASQSTGGHSPAGNSSFTQHASTSGTSPRAISYSPRSNVSGLGAPSNSSPRNAGGNSLGTILDHLSTTESKTGAPSSVSSVSSSGYSTTQSVTSSHTNTTSGNVHEMSPLSETIPKDRFHPIYQQSSASLLSPSNNASNHAFASNNPGLNVSGMLLNGQSGGVPQEKKIVAIAPHPGQQAAPKLAEHFDQRPTRGEMRREMSSGTIDRSEWVSKVLARNPDVANLRERVQPLHRAISFCELYNRGRGKQSVSKELMLQLIMQYFDHEGLRGALKTLEKETQTPFQFRNLDELQLLDARLISLLMIALNDIETIWDVAMGEKASTRLLVQKKNDETSSLAPLSTASSATSVNTTTHSALGASSGSPSIPAMQSVLQASQNSNNFERRDSSASTLSTSGRSIRITGSGPTEYEESTFNMTQDPDVAATNMEILEEMLAALRLREQDQFVGYSPAQLCHEGDINIWEDPYDDELILEPETGQIVAGSLNRLVELLTPEEEVDLVFVRAFLVTYQLFTTSTMLLAKLSQRYNAPRDPTFSDEEWRKRVLPIQIRVVNVIKMWIEEFHSDFDDLTVSSIRDFLNFQVREYHPSLASKTLALLEKFCSSDTDGMDVANASAGTGMKVVQFSFSVDPPRPIVPKNIFSPHLTWMDVEEEEIARQLTLIEFEYFYKIRTSEFLHQSWSKLRLKHRAPHILALIRRFNNVSEWVGTQIVVETRLKQRAIIFAKLVGIAEHLRKLQNYNTLMAFVAVFNSAAVGRLKHTISEMPPRWQQMLTELKTLMRPDDAYLNYRTELEESIPPCVPYLGLYLTELTHAEDGQPNLLDGLVNFSKCRLVHSIIAHINAHQQKGYNIQAVYQIQQFLRDPHPRLGDKAIFSHSSLVEPRGSLKSQIVQ